MRAIQRPHRAGGDTSFTERKNQLTEKGRSLQLGKGKKKKRATVDAYALDSLREKDGVA